MPEWVVSLLVPFARYILKYLVDFSARHIPEDLEAIHEKVKNRLERGSKTMSNSAKLIFTNEVGQTVQGVSVAVNIPGVGYTLQNKVSDLEGVVVYGGLDAHTQYGFKYSAVGYVGAEVPFTTGDADQTENFPIVLKTVGVKDVINVVETAAKDSKAGQVAQAVDAMGGVGVVASTVGKQVADTAAKEVLNQGNAALDADAAKAKGWIDDRQAELTREIATTKDRFVKVRDTFQLEALNILEQGQVVDVAVVALKIKAAKGIQDLLDKLF